MLDRGRLAALHARARPGHAAVVGLAVQAAAARAALRRGVRRRAVVPARAGATRPQLVEDFRRFVAARRRRRGRGRPLGGPARPRRAAPADHVGPRRAAGRHAAAAARARRRAAPGRRRPRRENRSPLPLPAGRLRRARAPRSCASTTRADYAALRLRAAAPAAADGGVGGARSRRCCRSCAPRSTSTRGSGSSTGRPARRGGAQAAEEKLERPARARSATRRSPAITNLEGETEFDVRWAWADGGLEPGFTAVVRVHDEARIAAVGAAAAAARGAPRRARRQRLDRRHRRGRPRRRRRTAAPPTGWRSATTRSRSPAAAPSTSARPPRSVHSLVHFYNWSFAHVRTGYALKWDGDMVLTDAAVAALRDLAWQLEATEAIVRIPRHPLYVAGDGARSSTSGCATASRGRGPTGPATASSRRSTGSCRCGRRTTPVLTLPDWSCVELKHLDADEFAHWSRHRLRRVGAHAPQAARVGGLPRARRRRGSRRTASSRSRRPPAARRRLRARGLGGRDRLGRPLGRRPALRRARARSAASPAACAPA